MRSRYYDADSRIFTTPDTYAGDIYDPLSINAYTFAENNPVNYSDPSGHGLWSKIKSVAKSAWNGIKKAAKTVANGVKKVANAIADGYKDYRNNVCGATVSAKGGSGSAMYYNTKNGNNKKVYSANIGGRYKEFSSKAEYESYVRRCTTDKRIKKQKKLSSHHIVAPPKYPDKLIDPKIITSWKNGYSGLEIGSSFSSGLYLPFGSSDSDATYYDSRGNKAKINKSSGTSHSPSDTSNNSFLPSLGVSLGYTWTNATNAKDLSGYSNSFTFSLFFVSYQYSWGIDEKGKDTGIKSHTFSLGLFWSGKIKFNQNTDKQFTTVKKEIKK